MTGTVLALALCAAPGAATFEFAGQASGWLGGGQDTGWFGRAGLRYIPALSAGAGPLDAELSVHGTVKADLRSRENPLVETQLEPYRVWLRLSATRFEVRAGLQKLNFGSATVLRPLQWFDKLDPRDPLGLTGGVYGLLLRAYPWGNANLWAWGLLGNHEPKGLEKLPTARWSPEAGGRFQVPVPRGEVAATYHHRAVDYSGVEWVTELRPEQDEDRLGLDAKLDAGIGLWVEGMVARETRREWVMERAPFWTRAGTVGVDYTFGLGNGLTVLAEGMAGGGGSTVLAGEWAGLTAATASYPLGLLDRVHAIGLFDWRGRRAYGYVAWQRTWDNWLLAVAGFWGPDSAPVGAGPAGIAGRGLQLTVAFNY